MKKYQYQIPLALFYSWLETITDVLVYLHSKYSNFVSLFNRNIIHRDLKPENILLSTDSHSPLSKEDLLSLYLSHPQELHIKVADFGIARQNPHVLILFIFSLVFCYYTDWYSLLFSS